jgi:hypothetical protein
VSTEPPPVDGAPTRRRRRGIRWLIALVIVVVLLVIAFIVGDSLARTAAEGYIRDQLVSRLDVPADQAMSVEIAPGSVLLQALGGSLDSIDVSIDDATIGGLTGDAHLTATRVPLDSSQPLDELEVTVSVGPDAVESLLTDYAGLDVSSVELADGRVTIGSAVNVFGLAVPLGLTLRPSVDAGDLVLMPSAVSVNDTEVDLDDLSSTPIGPLVSTIAAPQTICLASRLPSVVTLTDIAVTGSGSAARLSVTARADGIVLAATDFATVGSCD